MMQKTGLKAPIYRHFRKIEQRLYAISDRIGCMSQANVDYIKRHEPQISAQRIHINPNAFEAIGYSNSQPVYKEDGTVDMDASRRVSFRFLVNVKGIS